MWRTTMSDFTSGFWNWYVALITILGIAGCAILLWTQSRHKVRLDEKGEPEKTTGHVWDEDLTELNTPMPRWWMVMFYLTIVFGVGYLCCTRAWAAMPAASAGNRAAPTGRNWRRPMPTTARCSRNTCAAT
jgi:hypothetical protein